jgi:hypothetical protein
MAFDPNKAQAEIVPSFKFERIGDGFKMRVTDVSDDLELDDKEKDVLRGTGRYLVIKGEILAAVGGNKDEDDNVTDVPTGEWRSILCQYEYKAVGKDSYTSKPAIITKAVAKAITEAGATSITVGGELIVKHHELGKRNAENPSWNRPKFYTASYTPPAKSVNVAAIDTEAPF